MFKIVYECLTMKVFKLNKAYYDKISIHGKLIRYIVPIHSYIIQKMPKYYSVEIIKKINNEM